MTDPDSAPFSTVTYTVPFARLQKLSRSGSRKSFKSLFVLIWGWMALYFGMLVVAVTFKDSVDVFARDLSQELGLSFDAVTGLLFAAYITVFLLGLIAIRRIGQSELKSRVNWDQQAVLNPVPGGLHVSTPSIEYILKWPGIHEVLREPDGLVFVHGALFFIVPDAAFSDQSNRARFLDYIKQNLPEQVLERSAKELNRA